MGSMLEIRWHGRGGQGAKTASLLLAEAAAMEGKYSQGFPDYGPERMGAPMRGFNRISDEPVNVQTDRRSVMLCAAGRWKPDDLSRRIDAAVGALENLKARWGGD